MDISHALFWASQVALVVKNLPTHARGVKRCVFNPWVRKIFWKRQWQLTLVFLLGKSHGQRSLSVMVHEVAKEPEKT